MMLAPPDMMKAVCFDTPGGAEVLEIREVQTPIAGEGEVIVKVAYAGVNRPDVLQRLGLYPPPAGACPRLGLEVSGEVVSVGPDVGREWLGQRLMCLCNGGGYAQFVSVPLGQCISVPSNMDMAFAASLPEVYFTVWQNLIVKAGLKAGQHLLVHGGSSGIGTASIQIAKSIGAVVHVTVGSDAKAEFCDKLGADYVYNYKVDAWPKLALKNSGEGIHVVLDMVAGPYLKEDLYCLAPSGKIIVIALLGGRIGEVDAAQLMMKQAVLTGSTLRPRAPSFKAEIAAQLADFLPKAISSGKVKRVIEKEFSLEDVQQAHRWMESGQGFGKIVLKVHG